MKPTITDVSGYVGNFITTVETEGRVKKIKHGASVIAIGADVYKPVEYLYGENDRVFTHLELGERIARESEKVIQAESLVMIQCVGCRNEDRNYCSRVCCSHAVKNALKLKEINPGDGYLHSLSGYENVRVQRGCLPGSIRERCQVHPL